MTVQTRRSIRAASQWLLLLGSFAMMVHGFLTGGDGMRYILPALAAGALSRRTLWERWLWLALLSLMILVILLGLALGRFGQWNWTDGLLLALCVIGLVLYVSDRPSTWGRESADS